MSNKMTDIKCMSQENGHIRNIEEIKRRMAKIERLRPVSGKQKPVPASEVPNLSEEQKVVPDAEVPNLAEEQKVVPGAEVPNLPEEKKVVPDAATLSVPELLRELDACKVGNWRRYEALVKRAMLLIFGDLVDQENQGTHVSIGGGFADIELYFCDEMVALYPNWVIWRVEYGIKSILVEVKKLRDKAAHEHVGQLKIYMDLNNKGRFAFLTSQKSFSPQALKTIKLHNEKGYLMLPLDQDALKELLKLSRHDRKKIKIMRYMRRIRERVSRSK